MAAPEKAPDNVAAWFEIPASDFNSEGNRVGLHSMR